MEMLTQMQAMFPSMSRASKTPKHGGYWESRCILRLRLLELYLELIATYRQRLTPATGFVRIVCSRICGRGTHCSELHVIPNLRAALFEAGPRD